MAKLLTKKVVNILPTPLTADTIYFVKAGIGFDLYVTNSSGTIVAYPLNSVSNSSTTFGDIKTGIQTTDHNGWVKLDGRAKSTLTATQQAEATALGIGTNLPDASNSVLMQNGTALGSVSGSNSKTITQANLPNVNLTANGTSAGTPAGSISVASTTATMQSAGDHRHENGTWRIWDAADGAFGVSRSANITNPLNKRVSTTSSDMDWTSTAGVHTHTINPHNHMATFSGTAMGTHTHTVPLEGSGTPIDITPRSLSVNTFIYLGN